MLLKTFKDGSFIEYAYGSFDEWCIFLNLNNRRYAPKDVEYFNSLKVYSEVYGVEPLINFFVDVYNYTDATIRYDMFDAIERRCYREFKEHSLELTRIYSILYAGMVAEENKLGAILKKRIKRLGVWQVLCCGKSAYEAANFSRGKGWRELDKLCKSYGF